MLAAEGGRPRGFHAVRRMFPGSGRRLSGVVSCRRLPRPGGGGGGHPDYWYRFVGLDGAVVGIDRFGLSAPGDLAMAELGMTVENVADTTRRVVRQRAVDMTGQKALTRVSK